MQIRLARLVAPVESKLTRTTHRQRATALIAALFVLYMVRLAILIDHITYTSDGVAQQTMLALRGKYGKPAFWSSEDNYFLKYPVYVVARHLFGMNYRALAFEVLVFNIVLFASVALSYYLLVRTGALVKAPLWLIGLVGFWTISVGDPSLTLSHPNGRDPELGLAVLLVVGFGLFYAHRRSTRITQRGQFLLAVCFGLAAGLLIFDDPYFLYAVDGTFGLVTLYVLLRTRSWGQLNAERQYLLWTFLATSAVVYVVAGKVALHLGLHIYASGARGVAFAQFSTFGTGILNTVGGMLSSYHGLFFGRPLGVGAYQLVVNALIMVAVIGLGVGLLRTWRRPDRNGVQLLLPLMALVVTASYLISNNSGEGLSNFRYFIVFLPIFLLLFPTALMTLKESETAFVLRRLVVAGLLISAVWNCVQFVTTTASGGSHEAHARGQYAIAHKLEKLGLHKGYANYWDANTTTYFSKGSAVTIPASCIAGKLSVFYWLMDSAWLQKPASRTYVLVNSSSDPIYQGLPMCTPAELNQQFGPPARKVTIDAKVMAYVYNFDITSDVPPRTRLSSP